MSVFCPTQIHIAPKRKLVCANIPVMFVSQWRYARVALEASHQDITADAEATHRRGESGVKARCHSSQHIRKRVPLLPRARGYECTILYWPVLSSSSCP